MKKRKKMKPWTIAKKRLFKSLISKYENNNFYNSQNYITNNGDDKRLKKFYFSILEKDVSLQKDLLFISLIFSALSLLFLTNLYLPKVLLWIIFVTITIFLSFLLPYKFYSFLLYSIGSRRYYFKYIGFHSYKHIKNSYNKNIDKYTNSIDKENIDKETKKFIDKNFIVELKTYF